jgi:hypothetical protein
MRRGTGAAAALLGALAAGCATAGVSARTGAASPRVPVSVSSMPSVYGIQLRLAGSAVVRDGWLYVELPTGSVRTYQGSAEAWDLLLRAQLATCDGRGRWRVLSESRPARIAPLVGLTRDDMLDTTTRSFGDTLRLDLGVPRGTALDSAWVAFEVAWPVESVLAKYTLHAHAPLAAPAGRRRDARHTAEDDCRR